jgi:hypothetical protein
MQEFVNQHEFEYFLPIDATHFQVNAPAWKSLVNSIIDLFHPDLIHVHHALHSTFDIINGGVERGLPISSAQHYYAICPNLNLMNATTGKFCDIPQDLSICTVCLNQKFGLTDFSLALWREQILRLIAQCDLIVSIYFGTCNLLANIQS